MPEQVDALLELLESLPITVKVLETGKIVFCHEGGMLMSAHQVIATLCASVNIFLQFTPQEIEAMQEMPMQVHREISWFAIGITHHLPDKNWAELIHIGARRILIACTNPSCDIAVHGHIHQQFFRYGTGGTDYQSWIDRSTFLGKNLRNLRAMYALLEILTKMGLKDVDFRRVDYDVQKELQLAKDFHLPYYQVYW